mgnify:CR=1 FL=1
MRAEIMQNAQINYTRKKKQNKPQNWHYFAFNLRYSRLLVKKPYSCPNSYAILFHR